MRYGELEYLLMGDCAYMLDMSPHDDLDSLLTSDFLDVLEAKGVKTIVYGKESEYRVSVSKLLGTQEFDLEE